MSVNERTCFGLRAAGDQRSQYAVRVSDDMWSGAKQGLEIDCVDFEVVPSGRTGRVATPMNERQRPARAQGG